MCENATLDLLMYHCKEWDIPIDCEVAEDPEGTIL